MRTRPPSSLPSEFPAFCEVVRTWLSDVACLDPSLTAVADLVERTSGDGMAPEQVADLAADAADIHGVLGASALLSLWSGLRR